MKRKWLIAAGVGIALAGWLWWGNVCPETSEVTVTSARLPAGFDGFRIAQVSDLHNARFGENNEKLLSMLRSARPDVILLTGDLIDCRDLDIPVAVAFAEEAVKIAPCYYATGNHEFRIKELPQLLDGLESAGVTVLRNEKTTLERSGDRITLLGLDDPAFRSDYMVGDSGPVLTAALEELVTAELGYTIVLSHRPEWFKLYCRYGLDLVFSGHAHGGQFRLPFVGGLIAPNQGIFPQYDAGVFTEGNTSMVVSRGIGASIIPLRINNRPELVVAELQRQEA